MTDTENAMRLVDEHGAENCPNEGTRESSVQRFNLSFLVLVPVILARIDPFHHSLIGIQDDRFVDCDLHLRLEVLSREFISEVVHNRTKERMAHALLQKFADFVEVRCFFV